MRTPAGTTTLNTWDLRDPAFALWGIHRLRPLAPGRAVMALVNRPSTEQIVHDAEVLSEDGKPPQSFEELRDRMEHAAHRLFAGRTGPWPPTHAFVIVVARHGRVVVTDEDRIWSYGLMYANHLEPAFNGELLLVTEHGWRSDEDLTCGRYPALARPDQSSAGPDRPAGVGGSSESRRPVTR